MRRREFVTVLGGTAATWPLAAARAQQSVTPVIGFLNTSSPDAYRLRAFHQGLKEVGFAEGARTWPSNTAGPTVNTIDCQPWRLNSWRLELLRQLLPKAIRIDVLADPANGTTTESMLRGLDTAARRMGMQIQVFNVSTIREIDAAFADLANDRPDGLFVGVSPFLLERRVQLAQLAARHVIPAIYQDREHAEVGGLMSYGASIGDAYRQLGIYAGRVLKGAKPAELPVVQSSKFELVINHSTARMLGLTLPPTLLSIADDVIE